MRRKASLFFILCVVFLNGCFTAPEYPVNPVIEFEQIEFKEVPNFQDSLILTINFRDGDGDLGLYPDEIAPPYNSLSPVPKESDGRYLTLADRSNPPFDTLPPYEFPYYCYNYQTPLEHNDPRYENDTIYFQRNENGNNIFIQYFVMKNGQYSEFDWETELQDCTESFDGRFPVLDDLSGDKPLEGKLRYGMLSRGFLALFRNDTLKLRVRIKDRALNSSNTIETPGFVLRDIQVD